MNALLEQKIKEYFETNKVYKELEKRVKTLSSEIKEELTQLGIDKESTTNGFDVLLVEKVSYDYPDEIALRSYLKENGLSDYILEKIDSTKLNKDIKDSKSLAKKLNTLAVKTTTISLSVKESK